MTLPVEISNILLESLKTQAEKYKELISSNLSHAERKDFDSELKQLHELLAQMTNSQTVLTFNEIESLKNQFEIKLNEFENILNNIDVSNITLNLTPEQIESLKGDKGQDGQSFTFDMFTPEQLESLKGEKGDKGEDGQSFTFDMFTPEQLQSLKGDKGDKGDKGEDGLITVDSMTEQQKQEIANLVNVSSALSSNIDLIIDEFRNSPFLIIKTKLLFHQDIIFDVFCKYTVDSYVRKKVGFFYQSRSAYRRELESNGTATITIKQFYDSEGYLNLIIPYSYVETVYIDVKASLKPTYNSDVSYYFSDIEPSTTLDYSAYYLQHGL